MTATATAVDVVMTSSDLTYREARVLLFVASREDGEGAVFTHQEVSQVTGLHFTTVTRALRALRDHGLIRYQHGDGRKPSRAWITGASA